MLAPPDAELVRRDSDLPGLAVLLDPEAFVAALGPRWPGLDPSGAEVTYLRYKPGQSCLAAYRLRVDGEPFPVYAKAYGPGAAAKLDKRRAKGARAASGPARIVLPELSALVFPFPDDDELETLRELADPATWTTRLRKLLPRHPGLWDAEARTLAYKPERRYVAQLRGRGGEKAVLKYYTAEEYPAASRNAKTFASRGSLRIAPRIGRSNGRRILAFEWLEGRLLSEILAGGPPERGPLRAAGRALAELHAQRPKRLAALARSTDGENLRELAEGIGFLCPDAAGEAEALARRAAGSLAAASPADVPLHGDFYAKQVVVEGEVAGLLDLDRAVRGDPASDLGRFIAHLESGALRGKIPPGHVPPAAEGLLAGYGEIGPLPPLPRLALHTAVGLFGLAMDPFRLREPDWPDRIRALLARAGAILDGGAGSNPSALRPPASSPRPGRKVPDAAVDDPFRAASDPGMPFLREALDPDRVRECFNRHLGDLTGGSGEIHPLAIRVVRHKPGRRALVEYDLRLEARGAPSAAMTLLGKARAKGADRRSVPLLRDLRKAGFGDDSEDGISVPEPVGIVPELGMWLQRKVAGVPSTRLLAEPGGAALAGRIAEAVYKVHRSGLAPERRHTMADELEILTERLEAVARIHPRWAGRLEAVREACLRLGASVPEPAPCPIHRDFYADHVLVDGNRIWILDFDLFCAGDPALDAGNFIGHLTEQGLRTLGDPEALAARAAAMEERFVRLGGERTRAALRAYALLTLARHISISTLIPQRRPLTGPLLDLCERRLRTAGRPVRGKGIDAGHRGDEGPGAGAGGAGSGEPSGSARGEGNVTVTVTILGKEQP